MGLFGDLEALIARFGRLERPKASSVSLPASAPSIRRKVMFFCETQENSHGVPIVMNNIAQGLRESGEYDVYMLINGFDKPQLALYLPTEPRPIVVQDREELVRVAGNLLSEIDILHIHSWHFADPFVYFDDPKQHNRMPAQEFLSRFPRARVVFTDHSNPTEDLDTILTEHGIHYDSLSEREKREFLESTRLRERDSRFDAYRWDNGWPQTAALSRAQMYTLADVVTHVSKHQWDINRKLVPGNHNDEKHVVVYNGIDLTRYSNSSRLSSLAADIRRRYGILDGEHVIFYSGRATEAKGFYDLLDALVLLQEQQPDLSYKAMIATKTHGVAEEITRRYPSLQDRIILTPYIEDREELAAHYKLADVLVQPTRGECFNQAIGEALSVGTPTITTAFSGPKEVYVDHGVSYGVSVRDPPALAQTLNAVLRHPEDAHKMASKGQRYVVDCLSVDRMIDNYNALYEGLLSGEPLHSPTTTKPAATMLQDHRYQEALIHLRRGEYNTASFLVDALSTSFNDDHAQAELQYLRGMLHTIEAITHEADPQKRIGNDPNRRKVVKHERQDSDGRGLPLYGLFSVVDVDFMNTFAWREIARTALMDFGRYEDALEFLDYTLLVDPTDNEAHLLRARIYRALGSPVEAAEAYAKIDPNNPKYDYVKGESQTPADLVERCNLFWATRETLKEKTPDVAFPAYKAAIENYLLLGTNDCTSAALYLVYEFLSRNKETTSSYQRATLLYYQAIGQEKKGALADARSSLEQALEQTSSEDASQIRRRLEDVECALFVESYKEKSFKVTYIMPTKNPKKEQLYKAIDSILAQGGDLKEQTDIVIVDDGSTENIAQEIRNRYMDATNSGQIKVIRRYKNMGQSAAETLALRIAFSGTSDYLTFLDSDDIALPNRTTKLVSFLEEHRDIDFVHARVNFIDQDDNHIPEHPTAHWFRDVAWSQQENGPYDITTAARLRNWQCPINKQTVMIRTATARRAGFENVLWGYMGLDNSGQDMVYWTSVAQTGAQFGFLNDAVANYRLR